MTTVDYYRSPPQYNNPFSSSAPTSSSASTSSSTTTTSSTPFPTDDLQNCFWGPVIDTNLPASITFTSPTSSLNPHQLPLLSTSTSVAIRTPTTPFSASASPVLSAIGSRKRRRRTTTTEIDEHVAWVAAATSTPVDQASPPMSSTPPSPGARSSSSGGGHGASSSFRNVSACNRCRLRKNRCDQRLPACSSCEKADVKCVGYDPLNKREVPRSYVYFLEQRVNYLESLLGGNNIPFISAEDFPDLPISSSSSIQSPLQALPPHSHHQHHNLPSPTSISTPMSITSTLPPSPPPQQHQQQHQHLLGQLTPPHPGMQETPQCVGPCCWAAPTGVQIVMRDFHGGLMQ